MAYEPLNPLASDPHFTAAQHAVADLAVPAGVTWREVDTGFRKTGTTGTETWSQLPYEGAGSVATRMLDPDELQDRSLSFNVASTYGTTAAAIAQAMTDANALAVALGGKTVTINLDARTWNLESTVTLLNYVRIQGAGRGQTIVKPTGNNPAFTATRTNSTRLTGFELCDLTIDCSSQSGTYSYTKKGVYILYARASAIRRVTIKDAYATALGFDYPADHCVIEDCVFDNAGRGNTGSGGGGNGLGVLVGYQETETLAVINCVALNCKQYGFLVETHNSASIDAIGYRFVGCFAQGCGMAGFQDGGCSGAIFDGCIAYRNDVGFAVDSGDAQPGDSSPGARGRISNCVAGRNRVGILYDASLVAPKGSFYTIANNTVWSNSQHGVQVLLSSVGDVNKLSIRDNEIHSNGPSSGTSYRGISISTSGTSKCNDLVVTGNNVGDNWKTGIYIDCDVTGGRIDGNRSFDSGVSRQTTGLYIATGRTLTRVLFDANDLQSCSTPVNLIGSLASCAVSDCPGWTSGSGSPSSNSVVAPKGTLFIRTDGSAGNNGSFSPGTLLYINVDGSTGWQAII